MLFTSKILAATDGQPACTLWLNLMVKLVKKPVRKTSIKHMHITRFINV